MDLFLTRTIPYMARSAYLAEARHLLTWSALIGLAEGNVSAVVMAKTFDGSDWLIGIAASTPLFAKLLSLVWGMISVGRPKLPILGMLCAAGVVTMCSVALTPRTPIGAWLFLVQMAATQMLLAGVVTVRTALWRANYARAHRGQITARLQLIRAVVSIGAMVAAAVVFDRDPNAYLYVYPIAAGLGLVAVVSLSGMRVRGEKSQMRQTQNSDQCDLAEGLVEPFSVTALLSPGHVVGQMVRVLRGDARFARYCKALMFIGSGNLLVIPVMATIVSRDLDLGYLWSFALLEGIPKAVMIGALFIWAPYFDRVGVVRFRVITSACWLAHLVLGTAGTLAVLNAPQGGSALMIGAICLYSLSRVAVGFAMGGGALAWHLGHLHFARPEDAEVYMGVHVTLTGLRGLVMPMVGIWLWARAGVVAWLLAAGLSVIGLRIYMAMNRDETARGRYNPKTDSSGPSESAP
ncbi:MAG: hypothetical protein ACE5GE_01525 [Phycisphaerae bacterium]